MKAQDAPSRTVKTTDTVFGIIEALIELDGATVSEVADCLGMANSTIYDHLATLESKQYVVQNENEYYVGLKFLSFGMYARSRQPLWQPTKSAIDRLSEETGEGVRAWTEEYGRSVLLGRSFGEHAIRIPPFDQPGRMGFMHCHAGGKAILAHLPSERIKEIIDRYGLPNQTENTITDREALLEELARIRERGVVFSNAEANNDIRSVAAPILIDDTVLGSISIAAPVSRMQGEYYNEKLPNMVRAAVEEIRLESKDEFDLQNEPFA